MSWIAAAIKSVDSLRDTVVSNYLNKKENKRAREYNYGLWQEENAYNDPSAQMERLKNAGLNPNLVYGSGATTLAARSTPTQPANIKSPQLDTLDAVQAYQNIRQTDAMTDQVKAQTRATQNSWPVDVDLKNMYFQNASEQNDILKETLRQEKLRTLGMEADLAAQTESSAHKTGWSYRWSRNLGEWMNALSPFVQSGANIGESYFRWHK